MYILSVQYSCAVVSVFLFGEKANLVLLGIVYTQEKNPSWKKIGLFRPFFPPKLRSWVLLSSVRVPKQVPSAHRQNIRPKTSDLRPSYLFYIRYISHHSTYVGFNTYILNFYLRPTVNYSNECHFLLKSPTSVGIK
jgi:hypothetical protein